MKHQIEITQLINQTKALMTQAGFSDNTMRMYNNVFNFIHSYYQDHSVMLYSQTLMQELIREQECKIYNGLITKNRIGYIRRAVAYLHDVCQQGKILFSIQKNYEKPKDSFMACISGYGAYIRDKGFATSTIKTYLSFVRQFALYLERHDIYSFSQLTKKDLLDYLPRYAHINTSVKHLIIVLRSFGDYLFENGIIDFSIRNTLPKSPAEIRRNICGFTNEEMDSILEACDRDTKSGKRNYAIMTIARYTGLRCVDIVNLKFDSIDWNSLEIKTIQSKTVQPIMTPIDVSTANAIADYILNGRPESDEPFIFLRATAPYLPLNRRSASSIPRNTAKKAGIEWRKSEHKGMHSFRRALGSNMLGADVNIDTIREVLGHKNTMSIKPYISIQQNKLSMCALSLKNIPVKRKELM